MTFKEPLSSTVVVLIARLIEIDGRIRWGNTRADLISFVARVHRLSGCERISYFCLHVLEVLGHFANYGIRRVSMKFSPQLGV